MLKKALGDLQRNRLPNAGPAEKASPSADIY